MQQIKNIKEMNASKIVYQIPKSSMVFLFSIFSYSFWGGGCFSLAKSWLCATEIETGRVDRHRSGEPTNRVYRSGRDFLTGWSSRLKQWSNSSFQQLHDIQVWRQDCVTGGAEINFGGLEKFILCEFERGTGARETFSSLDQMNKVRSKDSKGFSGPNRKFKRFFRAKTGDLQKKRSSSQKRHEIRCQSTKKHQFGPRFAPQ